MQDARALKRISSSSSATYSLGSSVHVSSCVCARVLRVHRSVHVSLGRSKSEWEVESGRDLVLSDLHVGNEQGAQAG